MLTCKLLDDEKKIVLGLITCSNFLENAEEPILNPRLCGLISTFNSILSSRGIFPTQGLNPGLLHCRQILHQLSYQASPYFSPRINSHKSSGQIISVFWSIWNLQKEINSCPHQILRNLELQGKKHTNKLLPLMLWMLLSWEKDRPDVWGHNHMLHTATALQPRTTDTWRKGRPASELSELVVPWKLQSSWVSRDISKVNRFWKQQENVTATKMCLSHLVKNSRKNARGKDGGVRRGGEVHTH